MSSTIYGGKTVNGVFVEDMVDDSKDYVYYLDEQQTYFVRLSGAKVEESKEIKPAFVLFNSSRPFDVLYGKILDKEYLQYVDKFGRDTKLFHFELDKAKVTTHMTLHLFQMKKQKNWSMTQMKKNWRDNMEFVIKIPEKTEEKALYKKLVDDLDKTFYSTILDFKSILKMDIEKYNLKRGDQFFVVIGSKEDVEKIMESIQSEYYLMDDLMKEAGIPSEHYEKLVDDETIRFYGTIEMEMER